MNVKNYDRQSAINYAKFWAEKRNPKYYNFDNLGGDCTNFISQCVFEGAGIMNFTNVTGWYYISSSDRTASWTGVEFFYNFLINNNSFGPFAKSVNRSEIMKGDIIQLGRISGQFYHSLFISDIIGDQIFVCTHSFDALNRPLSSYIYEKIRFLHVVGVRE